MESEKVKELEEMITNLLGAYNQARQFNGELMLDTIVDMAKYLVNKYQPKIDRDKEVVISKEDYEKLHSFDLAFNILAEPNPVLISAEEYDELKQSRKETAEKSFNIVKKVIDKRYAIETPSTRVTLSNIINQIEKELAKQFNVEIQE